MRPVDLIPVVGFYLVFGFMFVCASWKLFSSTGIRRVIAFLMFGLFWPFLLMFGLALHTRDGTFWDELV